jgi:8-oxo-dGTP diphosphatase
MSNDTDPSTDLSAGRHYPGITQVAAAVLLRPAAGMGESGAREYLLAQRPPGKAYAGYWEFPGGKVEVGESTAAACVRELEEELGIRCDEVLPWISQEFVYPHAHVQIRFFRIHRWRGVIAPLEHSGFAWVRCGSAPTVSPVLPANDPILRALALPETYAITCADERGVEAELERAGAALAAGVRLFQLRDKTLATEARARFADALIRLARPHGARVLINDDIDLARECGADGIHLSAAALRRCTSRPEFDCVAASCHDAAELELADHLGVDFAVLGPVLATPTHPGATTLGWGGFAHLVERLRFPVFALGGMRSGMKDEAQAHGAHGVALMRHWP